jgi:hypothetical protein
MHLLRLLIALFLFGNANAQQRIGVDFNSRLINGHLTVQYHRVIKGPFLFTAGIGGGFHGYSENVGSESQVRNGFYQKGYPYFPDTEVDEDGDYLLRGTDTKGAGWTAAVGIGVFKEFANFHGFRFNINHTFSWMRSDTKAFYKDFDQIAITTSKYKDIWHPLGAISLELYHTLRVNGRFTFYWGVKLPYYYSLDKGRYNPKVDSELFHKFLPDLSIGFTRAVGKCD